MLASSRPALCTSVLQDEFPEVLRFTVSLFPSEDDDVVTSPYNSMLSLAKLVEHADAVLPIENQALYDMVAKVDKQIDMASRTGSKHAECDLTSKGGPSSQSHPIAYAACLLHLIHA
jgi:tubulin epsilon